MSIFTYKYYDTPEGHDVYKKCFVTSKYAALTGLAGATTDVLLFSHPKGVLNTMGRYMFYFGPLVGMATAFTVTANMAQNYRGKNDELNYFLGGLAAGSIAGTWIKSPVAAVPIAVFLGAVAVVKKTAVDNGWKFIPTDFIQAKNNAVSVKYDFTLAKDHPELRNWTTGK